MKLYQLWTQDGAVYLGKFSTIEKVEQAKKIFKPLVSDPDEKFDIIEDDDIDKISYFDDDGNPVIYNI